MIKQTRAIFIFLSLCWGMAFSTQSVIAEKPPVSSARFAVFSKNNDQLIYLNRKNQIVKLNTRTGQLIKKVPISYHYRDGVRPFAATPDGFKLLAQSAVGIEVIHNGTGKILRTLPYPPKAKQAILSSLQSHSGVLLAIPYYYPLFKKYYLIHTGSGKLLHTIDVSKFYPQGQRIDPNGFGFSYDRHTIAFAIRSNGKNILHLYDIYKNKEIARIDLPNTALYNSEIQFSRNGKKVLLNAQNNRGYLLVDLTTQTIKTSKTAYYSLIGFSPNDQNLILVQPEKNTVSRIDIQSGQISKTTVNLSNNHSGGTQSADRSIIAVPINHYDINKKDIILLINATTGKLIRQFNIE